MGYYFPERNNKTLVFSIDRISQRNFFFLPPLLFLPLFVYSTAEGSSSGRNNEPRDPRSSHSA